MKTLAGFLIGIVTATVASIGFTAESAQSKVNYHLRKMQNVMDANLSSARVNSIKAEASQFEAQEEYRRNDPTFGIGDEGLMPLPPEPSDAFLPSPPRTAEEAIRMELAQRRITNYGTAPPTEADANQEFIREFKRKAAAKGVQLEVNPVTFEVRKSR